MPPAPLCCTASRLSLLGVVAYVVIAAIVLALARIRFDRPTAANERRACRRVAAVLLVLAVWRASAAEEWVLAWLRDWAQADGVYQGRRHLQQIAVAVVALAAGAALGRSVMRSAAAPGLRLAWAATLVLLGLGLVRLVSLHEVDAILYAKVWSLNVNRLLEAILLACILAGSLYAARGRPVS